MVAWEVLDADCDDETRQAGDVGSLTSLYEVVKLAYLQPDHEVVGLPTVHASAGWGRVAVALDKTLFVLGEGYSSLLLQLALEETINLVLWVPQGEFLILGDAAGKVHYVHVPTHKVLITRQLPVDKKSGKVFVGGWCRQMNDGTFMVSLVTSFGQVFSLKNIDIEMLSEGLRLGDAESLKCVATQITLSVDVISLQDAEISSVGSNDSGYWLWCAGQAGPVLWTPFSLQDPQRAVAWNLSHLPACHRIIPVWDGRYLVTLSVEGNLGVVCGVTGLTLWEGDTEGPPILDITLLQEDEEQTQFLLLHNDPASEGNLLRIVSFPGFTTVYELAVNENTFLVSLGEGAESIMFLEPEVSCVMGVTKNLKLKSIVDGVPEARLAKLLVKRKFKEAEEFCCLFQLDIEEVYKARARFICDLLNPWNSAASSVSHTFTDMEGSTSLMEELLNTLGKISDAEFVTSVCIEAPMTNLATTKMILNYAKERLARTTQSEEGDHLSELMQRVSESCYCLHTFETVFPSSDIQHWLAFSHTDMLEECIEHLSQGNLDVVSTVWHRHQYEFSHLVDESCVSRVLASIPYNISSQLLCNWLPKNVLADLVRLCRSSLDIIATWADERVKKLEVLEKPQWPSCGLNLAKTIITVLENVTSDFLTDGSAEEKMAGQVAFSPSAALHQLQQTAHALQDLHLLATKFRIKIELNQYTQENKEMAVAALLDSLVCGEEVAPLMEGFLRSYFIRHQLNHDGTLAHYVLETLAAADQDWWAWQEAPWEDKLYAIINVMSDAQMRAECLLECVRVAPVPWSEGTQAGCELGLSLNTSLSSQLEDQRNMVGLKLVLRRYSLHMTNIDNPRNAKMILRNILSHNEETVMADAMCVVNSYRHLTQADAYFCRAVHLLTVRNVDGLKKFLLELNENHQKQTCQELVTYITQTLLLPPRGEKGEKLHVAVTEGLLSLESLLRKWVLPAGPDGRQDLFTIVYSLHALQIHYNMYPTLKDMESKAVCKTLLQDHVTAWYKENICSFDAKEQITCMEDEDKSSRRKSLFRGNISAHFSAPFVGDEDKSSRRKSLFVGDIPAPVPPPAPVASKEGVSLWTGLSRLQWLAFLLGVPQADLLSLLASLSSRSGRVEEAIQICREMLSDPGMSECSGVVHDVVRLVVEQQSHLSHRTTESPPFLNSTALQEREVTVKSHADLISIIHELLSSALLSAHPDLLNPLLKLGSWCQVGQHLYSQCHMEGVYTQNRDVESSNPYTNWKFSPLFCDASIPIEDNFVLPLITLAMEGCLKSHHPMNNIHFVPYQRSVVEATSPKDSTFFDNYVQDLVSHLWERGQDLLALLLPLKVLHLQSEAPFIGGLPDWQQVFTLLLKVIGAPKPDITLAISLLLLLVKRDALRVMNELIKRFGFDYIKLMSVAAAGRDFCSLLGLGEVQEQFEVLLLRSQWGKRLGEMNISFKSAFRGDMAAIKEVVGDLVSHSNCTFSLLYEYCEAFGVDVTDSLLCYMQTTLNSWSPVISEEPQPGEVVHVESPRAVLLKCQAIIAEVKNKMLLHQELCSQLKLLSSYNYELIQLVLEQLILLEDEDDSGELELHKQGLDVISFLKVYARQAPPSTTEVDDWITNHPQSLRPPDISKHRLPFHSFYTHSKGVMKIVEAELNVSTVDIWLQASHILKLNSDHMCLEAVHNTVSRTLELENAGKQRNRSSITMETSGSAASQWKLCCNHSTLLSHINKVICRMQNYELAAACANWVVNRLPPGADKVAAAEKSSLLMRKWKEETSEPKAVSAFLKMYNLYQQLATEHSLHKHGLAQPEYLALTRTPLDLVSALYKHPALNSLSTLCTHSMPDIHACVSEICSIAELKEAAIQFDLLEKWLPPPEASNNVGYDETVTNFRLALDPLDATEEATPDDASLSRVIYLLRCCPLEEAMSYLLNRALSEDASISASHRLRALRCLLAIADEAAIQKQYPKGTAGIRSLLKTEMYVSRLEALGHTSSVQQFNSVDKSALVEGLWRSQRHNPVTLCLITDICHDYKVTAASLWGALLTQLTRFVKSGQVEVSVMERVLLQLKSVPHLWVVPALTTAWMTFIAHPFTKAVAPVNESSMASCMHSVDLLLRHCPVVIPTAPLLQYCAALNLPVLALSIAAADQVESHDLQSMVEKQDHDTLKTSYMKMKPVFAFPKRVEELLEQLK